MFGLFVVCCLLYVMFCFFVYVVLSVLYCSSVIVRVSVRCLSFDVCCALFVCWYVSFRTLMADAWCSLCRGCVVCCM